MQVTGSNLLKVFIEEEHGSETLEHSITLPNYLGNNNNNNNNGSAGNGNGPLSNSTGSNVNNNGPNSNPVNGSNLLTTRSTHTESVSQWTVVSITPDSTVEDVLKAVSKKRNVEYRVGEYQLIITDTNGSTAESYETILDPQDRPGNYQQRAATLGHLGAFRFVFRKTPDEDDDMDSKSDDTNFIGGIRSDKREEYEGNFPAEYMEKRGKTNTGWRRRYFVLIEDKLFYYKRRELYLSGSRNAQYIPLDKPPAIIRILWEESPATRKGTGIPFGNRKDWWYFDIDTPARIYSLRTDNYDTLMRWVHLLHRRDETVELLEGLDYLIAETERQHADEDEERMEKYCTLNDVLADNHVSEAYLKYLQSKHCDEFWYFWQEWHSFYTTWSKRTPLKRQQFAEELYDKYIKDGAKLGLSEIRKEQRVEVKRMLDAKEISRHMYDPIQETVRGYLGRGLYEFLQSTEYFRCVVDWNRWDDEKKYEWPNEFEKKTFDKKSQAPQIHIPFEIRNARSPVVSPVFEFGGPMSVSYNNAPKSLARLSKKMQASSSAGQLSLLGSSDGEKQ